MKTLLLDIETNGLDWKKPDFKIHCVCAKELETGIIRQWTLTASSSINPLDYINQYNAVVAHYGQFFDFPVLEHVFNQKITAKKLDTKVLASLIFPEFKSHKLADWGDRLGLSKKTDFEYKEENYQTFTPQMLEQCHRDVEILEKLYKHLLAQNYSPLAMDIETEIATIIQRQVELGVAFNEKLAEQMYVDLIGKREKLTVGLQGLFKPWYAKDKEFIPKKDSKDGYTAGVPLTKIELNTFNPGSTDQIANRLMTLYRWQPTKFTETGKPAMDGAVLASLPYPEAKQLAEYADIKKIIGMLGEGEQAWLKLVKNGRLHGRVNTNGAVTGRMTHFEPNLAQVPAVGTFYGSESRSLFVASPGYVLVGADASSLELRCLAHFMAKYDNGDYVKKLLQGDIHTTNMHAAGLETRDQAKTFIYGLIYGAGDEKIGKIIGKGQQEGRKIRTQFLRQTPALAKLREDVINAAKKGYILGLDKRKLLIRSEHSALNTLLQSAGALIMKQALIIAHKKKPDLRLVLTIHDEFQVEALPEESSEVGKLLVDSIKEAGMYFNFRCPLDGEYKSGLTWKDTH